MDGGDMYEPFDVNATDFEYAINPGHHRRQTKEQQIYGVWADSDEEDGGGKPSFSASGKKASYTTPVSFVSGGVKNGNKMETNEEKTEETLQEDTSKAAPSRPMKASRGTARPRETGARVFAGMRSSATNGTADANTFGGWAKNSAKGDVVMQMMQKMGYNPGQGLGLNKQGIVEPVQAYVRPGRAALGAYGKEAQGPKFGESAAEAQKRNDAGGTAEEEPVRKRETWKKTNANRKIKYKTMDEVLREGEDTGGFSASMGGGVKIVDMTGPEQRVYNDYNSFSKRTRVPDGEADRKRFDVPELIYNLNTLVDLTEEEIRRNDRHVRFLKDQTEVLQQDKKQIEEKIKSEETELIRMEKVLSIVEEFNRMSRQTSPTLENCKDLFLRLRSDYATEYHLFGLDAIALTCILPMLKSYFATWDPLDPEEVGRGVEMLEEWKEILQVNKQSMFNGNDKDSLSAYDRCVWEAWMPSIRRAALAWNPRTNGPQMVNVIETWLPLLPGWIAENLFEQVIIPRIKEQVDQWNPSTDDRPIDSWLLPWQSIMGDRLSPVYPIIRQKLSRALQKWEPRDRSAVAVLRPWKDVFSQGTMQSFLAMNIVPKLERCLENMDLNPLNNTGYPELKASLEWLDLLSADVLAQVLVKSFFPQWYNNLCMWMNRGGVLGEIKAYYTEWKDRFSQYPTIMAFKPIQNEFARVMMAMQQMARGHQVTRLAAPGFAPTPPQPSRPVAPPAGYFQPQAPPPPPVAAPTNFKALVETWALNNGVLFAPQPNRFEHGRQIFSFGNTSIYFDGTAIFLRNPQTNQWMPMGFNSLVALCQ